MVTGIVLETSGILKILLDQSLTKLLAAQDTKFSTQITANKNFKFVDLTTRSSRMNKNSRGSQPKIQVSFNQFLAAQVILFNTKNNNYSCKI